MQTYKVDQTGKSVDNLVESELHTLTPNNDLTYQYVILKQSPFFITDNFTILHYNDDGDYVKLVEGKDYSFTIPYIAATNTVRTYPIYGGIHFLNPLLAGTIAVTYQTLGVGNKVDYVEVYKLLADRAYNPRTVSWDQLADRWNIFPPEPHDQDFNRVNGHAELIEAVGRVATAISETKQCYQTFLAHTTMDDNPHNVTKQQLGLEKVENCALATRIETKEGLSTNTLITPYSLKSALDPIKIKIKAIDDLPTMAIHNALSLRVDSNDTQLTLIEKALLTQNNFNTEVKDTFRDQKTFDATITTDIENIDQHLKTLQSTQTEWNGNVDKILQEQAVENVVVANNLKDIESGILTIQSTLNGHNTSIKRNTDSIDSIRSTLNDQLTTNTKVDEAFETQSEVNTLVNRALEEQVVKNTKMSEDLKVLKDGVVALKTTIEEKDEKIIKLEKAVYELHSLINNTPFFNN